MRLQSAMMLHHLAICRCLQRPPEPCAQVRILPGALRIKALNRRNADQRLSHARRTATAIGRHRRRPERPSERFHSSESMESDDAGHAWGEVRKPESPPDGRETMPGPAGHLKDLVQESHTSAHGGTTATGLGQPRVRLESSRTFTPESAGAAHDWESFRQVSADDTNPVRDTAEGSD